ncbi:hypothetical protein AX16_002968 [Volvariella volvacea WC 439]|nr:hypothetical protein AX16_002968 [Volvariella volvacea WC 439]
MPPRSFGPPKGSFAPPNDRETYKDILMFEERLKTTAASLQQRKSRYQLFLAQLLVTITFLLAEVLLPPRLSILSRGYTWALRHTLYPPDVQATVHPYFASGLLFVSVTTLVLFFASGMYSEKIAYANKYVPHANRALRAFNIYLNVRKPPLRSKFPFNPLSFFFPRPEEYTVTSPHSSSPPSPTRARSRGSSPTRPNTSIPIPPIPPASNPRGELMFFSRVDRNLKEGYERYRAAFERKRQELEREELRKWWSQFLFWRRWFPPSSATPQTGAGTGGGANVGGGGTPGVMSRAASTTSSRGGRGGSRSGTPPNAHMMKQRERSKSPDDLGPDGGRDGEGSGVTTSLPSRSTPRRIRVKREMSVEEGGDMRMLVLDRSMQSAHTKFTKFRMIDSSAVIVEELKAELRSTKEANESLSGQLNEFKTEVQQLRSDMTEVLSLLRGFNDTQRERTRVIGVGAPTATASATRQIDQPLAEALVGVPTGLTAPVLTSPTSPLSPVPGFESLPEDYEVPDPLVPFCGNENPKTFVTTAKALIPEIPLDWIPAGRDYVEIDTTHPESGAIIIPVPQPDDYAEIQKNNEMIQKLSQRPIEITVRRFDTGCFYLGTYRYSETPTVLTTPEFQALPDTVKCEIYNKAAQRFFKQEKAKTSEVKYYFATGQMKACRLEFRRVGYNQLFQEALLEAVMQRDITVATANVAVA